MRLGALYGATRIARSPPPSPCPKVPPFAPTVNSSGSLTHAAFASLELVLHARVAYASVPAMPGPRALSVESVTGERRPSPVHSRGTPHHRFVFASLELDRSWFYVIGQPMRASLRCPDCAFGT